MDTLLLDMDCDKWADACRAVAAAMGDTPYATMFVEMALTWTAIADARRRLDGEAQPISAPLSPDLRRRLH